MTKARLIDRCDFGAVLPDTESDINLTEIDGDLEIKRDSYGIPHISATTVHDAFFGQGFATAQDRLWHMDHDRRVAYGRWSEYAGITVVEEDIRMRLFQLLLSVESDYKEVDAETRAMLDAYTSGVNAFIDTSPKLPVEYDLLGVVPEPWMPWDCIASFKARHVLMGVYEAKMWRARLINVVGAERAAELWPEDHAGGLMVVPPGAEYAGGVGEALEYFRAGASDIGPLHSPDDGSNNWVISGSRTVSGKPLLAGDPHRGLDTPNVYYQNHVRCPEFDAIGLSFPGCPGFPHFGHNAYVAWSVTHAGADYQDLYIERFRDGQPPEYQFKGEWEPAEVRREVIQVLDSDPVEIDVAATRHGPVIQGGPSTGYGISFKYTATAGPSKGLQCLPRMLRSRSVDELDESMRDWVDPSNNFVFADVHGDIAYLNRGQLPIRSRANAWLPVPGWNGDHEWEGFVPFKDLARIRNPESGYIVTANNRIIGEDYPHYITLSWGSDFRARRIVSRVDSLRSATVSDMSDIHSERVSIPAQDYLAVLSEVEPLDEFAQQAIKMLGTWNGSMDLDSTPAAIYSSFRLHLNRFVLQSFLGPLADDALSAVGRGATRHIVQIQDSVIRAVIDGNTSMLPTGADWKSVMAEALSDGLRYLRCRFGDDLSKWQWGKIHYTKSQHTLSHLFPELAPQLDSPSVPMAGDGETPLSAGYRISDPFIVKSASVARYVFDLGNWDNSAWVSALGSSGHPGSTHYADQTEVWKELKLVPMLYEWDRISVESESTQHLIKKSNDS